MKNLIVLLTLIALTGCSAIKSRNIMEELQTFTGRAVAVCNTAEVFSSVGVPAPVLEACKPAMVALASPEYAKERAVVYDVADCAQSYAKDKEELARCVTAVIPWKDLAHKILR